MKATSLAEKRRVPTVELTKQFIKLPLAPSLVFHYLPVVDIFRSLNECVNIFYCSAHGVVYDKNEQGEQITLNLNMITLPQVNNVTNPVAATPVSTKAVNFEILTTFHHDISQTQYTSQSVCYSYSLTKEETRQSHARTPRYCHMLCGSISSLK